MNCMHGKVAEVDGGYFGGYIKPANRVEDRIDRRLAENQNGKRKVVVVIRERNGAGTFRRLFRYGCSSGANRDHIKRQPYHNNPCRHCRRLARGSGNAGWRLRACRRFDRWSDRRVLRGLVISSTWLPSWERRGRADRQRRHRRDHPSLDPQAYRWQSRLGRRIRRASLVVAIAADQYFLAFIMSQSFSAPAFTAA